LNATITKCKAYLAASGIELRESLQETEMFGIRNCYTVHHGNWTLEEVYMDEESAIRSALYELGEDPNDWFLP
jgi:hypothetical protein